MSLNQLITVHEIVEIYHTEISFVESLQEFGLIEIQIVNEERFINSDQLPQLEQYLRLHHDLDINPAGIDAINQLLQKVEALQQEIRMLRSRL